jgi:hypothetical protein
MIMDSFGEKIAECNECGATSEGVIEGVSDFHEFVRLLKDNGWVVRKDEDGEWVHFCSSDCAE